MNLEEFLPEKEEILDKWNFNVETMKGQKEVTEAREGIEYRYHPCVGICRF